MKIGKVGTLLECHSKPVGAFYSIQTHGRTPRLGSKGAPPQNDNSYSSIFGANIRHVTLTRRVNLNERFCQGLESQYRFCGGVSLARFALLVPCPRSSCHPSLPFLGTTVKVREAGG